jgi:hypothetical protein
MATGKAATGGEHGDFSGYPECNDVYREEVMQLIDHGYRLAVCNCLKSGLYKGVDSAGWT